MTALPRWTPPKRAEFLGVHHCDEPIEVTVVFNRKQLVGSNEPVAHADLALNHGADDIISAPLRTAIAAHNSISTNSSIEETHYDTGRRVMRLKACPAELAKLFQVELHSYRHLDTQEEFVACSKEPHQHLGVMAVLGLDRRPRASTYIKAHAPGSFGMSDGQISYPPTEVAHLYNFPDNTDGTGQCIAVIELGGGYTQSNLNDYFGKMGVRTPVIVDVPVLGTTNSPGSDADGEVQLDIEVIGCCAPGAKQAVYFANNTDQGFFEAISTAAHDTVNKPSVISISWGGPEDEWGQQAVDAINSALEDAAKLGFSITVAAGDNGAADGIRDNKNHCDFPSSSPYVLACGGTTLIAPQGRISLETVWNENVNGDGATGGGVSVVFPVPQWQTETNYKLSGRGVPDVAGLADPVTGYQVEVNGQMQVVGGTSAVAPLWAALIARMNQSLGKTIPQIQTLVYKIPSSCFHDVTKGNNAGYAAGAGWDPTTGLGSPNGESILEAMKQPGLF
ncbi:MAG TPA: S53 family peptidase [Dongiaceae bacterium]|nr:S53 family peptidase [Dongiaceae bacterium]